LRILLTNDDGIFAEGLAVLRRAVADLAENVYVIAPDRERSAASHAITMHRPLRVRETKFEDPRCRGWVVDGTPADCVKLALESLLPSPPDLVVAGINLGPNLGTDVLYSGTVASAVEGLLNGVPSLAVSLATRRDPDYEEAAAFVRELIPLVLERGLPPGTLLNINVPAGSPRGHRITVLGALRYVNAIDHRVDPRGRDYFWMAGQPEVVGEAGPETDIAAVRAGYISVTPLNVDMSDRTAVDILARWPIGRHGG